MRSKAFTTDSTQTTRALLLQGLVQGQGVRPTVTRIAEEMNLSGTVRNVMQGVEVHVVGVDETLDRFASRLEEELDARVTEYLTARQHLETNSGFRILPSQQGETVATAVPLDLVVCTECLAEVRSTRSRRFQYPFTSCTRCGPRYSIIREMPFDRNRTSMAEFSLCDACRSEYSDPNDRRFHAQTNACPVCGPQCWCTDRDGTIVARTNDSIRDVAAAIQSGKIVALKGIGGYQLICAATNDKAVSLLRKRKGRPTKPLPIMVSDTKQAQRYALISRPEQSELESSSGPIVLLHAVNNDSLSGLLHPGLRDIGIMLPTTPLHALVCDLVDAPIVVTSGNAYGSPIVYENEPAMEQLRTIADIWLHHDRVIERPVDDSVVRCFGNRSMTIRAGRGLAPMSVPSNSSGKTIAFGGHQKVATAFVTQHDWVLGPHIGDLDSEWSRQRLIDQQRQLSQLYRVVPDQTACDQHPDYFTTALAGGADRTTIAAQHHHAHVAAAMVEHGLQSEAILGFAFDGSGYGSDDSIWGGEVLLATAGDFERVAHLKSFRLPAGDVSVRQPWRTALSMIEQACNRKSFQHWLQYFDISDQESNIRLATRRGVRSTSMGRLFDAVATMILPIRSSHYEGEPAMMLEAACDQAVTSAYSLDFVGDRPVQMDWRPLIRRICYECNAVPPETIAMKFHRAIAYAIVELARRFPQYPAVLCGGVFQNRVLLELIDQRAAEFEIKFRFPGRIPTNDGGLAIGQLLVAAAQSQACEPTSIGDLREVDVECV